MAILSGIGLSRSKNKLGSMVLMNRSGIGVVAREYVADVKNPRSKAQMRTRVQWANLVNFYRLSKDWMPMAFENKKANQSDYNKFMSLNVGSNSVYLTKELSAKGAVVVSSYVVSFGSLRPIAQRVEGNVGISDLCTGSLVVTAATTIAELSSALIENTPSLRNGDQISFISYMESYEGTVPRSTCRAFEMPVDTTRENELISDYFPDFLCNSQEDNGKQVLVNSSVPAGAFTWVLSRTIGGKTYVSTQSLVIKSTINAVFTSDKAFNAAILSYGESDTNFLDSKTYGETTAASVPAVITSVYAEAAGQRYQPGEVFLIGDIKGAFVSAMVTGLSTNNVTRCRVTTNEGRIFEAGIVLKAVNSVQSDEFPAEMGNDDNLVTSISLLAGTKVIATIQFATSNEGGEME